MANNIISKDQKILYNSIPDQQLSYANQLTVKSWNDIINILKLQANINTDYLKKLHEWFIGKYDSTKPLTNILTVPADELGIPQSFAEYVLKEIDYIIKNPLHIKENAIVTTRDAGTYLEPTGATATVTGTGRKADPLEFTFNIPRGFDGWGVHLFSIDELTGDLIVYRDQQEQIKDKYDIDDYGNLCIVVEED